jgi:hypothetical protein
MKKYTLQRILMDMGIDFDIFIENIVNKDGSVFKFKLDFMGCNTEKQIKQLVEKYV